MVVSSANMAYFIFCISAILFVYNKYNTAPRTLPCGFPAYIDFILTLNICSWILNREKKAFKIPKNITEQFFSF